MEEKKSAIFSLPFHENRVQRALPFFAKNSEMTHKATSPIAQKTHSTQRILQNMPILCKHNIIAQFPSLARDR